MTAIMEPAGVTVSARSVMPRPLVTCDYASLVDVLTTVSVAVPVGSYAIVPWVSLEGRNGDLIVESTTGEISISARVPGAARQPGRVILDHRELGKLLTALTKDTRKRDRERSAVTITAADPMAPVLGVAGYEVPVTAYPVADYSQTPSTDGAGPMVWVDRAAFVTDAARVLRAAGREISLPMLTRVRVSIGEDGVELAATDRFRLAVARIPATGPVPEPGTGLIDARTLTALVKRFTSGDRVGIAVGEAPDDRSRMLVVCGDVTVTFDHSATAFPDYDTLFPAEVTGRLTVDRVGLLAQVRRASAVLDAKGDRKSVV